VGELRPDTERSTELNAWLNALLRREQDGDEEASETLIEAHTIVPRLWEGLDTLRQNAERAWMELTSPPVGSGRDFTRQAIRRELERVRRTAAGADPSPIERLLADRVALCWLQATHADTEYAQRLQDGMTFAASEFYQRRCERAGRQLLKAIQTLATVRRLLGPTIQLNVAERQINVAR